MQNNVIVFDEGSERLRISWDNRKIRKDTFMLWFGLLFWIVWAPVTLYTTALIFSSDSPVFYTIWCIFGWLGTLGIPYVFVQRMWVEWIEIDSQAISWGATGPFARKEKRIPLTEITEFGLGRHCDRYGEYQSVVTLNVYGSHGKLGIMPCHTLALWLGKEHKEAIFDRVREFVEKRSIPLTVTTYGA